MPGGGHLIGNAGYLWAGAFRLCQQPARIGIHFDPVAVRRCGNWQASRSNGRRGSRAQGIRLALDRSFPGRLARVAGKQLHPVGGHVCGEAGCLQARCSSGVRRRHEPVRSRGRLITLRERQLRSRLVQNIFQLRRCVPQGRPGGSRCLGLASPGRFGNLLRYPAGIRFFRNLGRRVQTGRVRAFRKRGGNVRTRVCKVRRCRLGNRRGGRLGSWCDPVDVHVFTNAACRLQARQIQRQRGQHGGWIREGAGGGHALIGAAFYPRSGPRFFFISLFIRRLGRFFPVRRAIPRSDVPRRFGADSILAGGFRGLGGQRGLHGPVEITRGRRGGFPVGAVSRRGRGGSNAGEP